MSGGSLFNSTNDLNPTTGLTSNDNKSLDLSYLNPGVNEGRHTLRPEFSIEEAMSSSPFSKFENKDSVLHQRYLDQGNGKMFLEGVGRVITNTAIDTLEAPVFIAGLFGGLDNATDNFAINALEELKQVTNEELFGNSYEDPYYSSLTGLQKLGSGQFWKSEGADAIAFFLSAMIPGMGMTKLGLSSQKALAFTSALVKLNKASKFLEAGEAAAAVANGSKSLAKLAAGIDTAFLTGYQTLSESAFEAKDIKDQMMNEFLANNPDATPEEIEAKKAEAGDAAARVFTSNLFILALPNYIQQSAIFGKLLPSSSKAMRIFKEEGIEGLKKYSPSLFKNVALSMGIQGISEANEEGMQFSLQEFENRIADRNGEIKGDNIPFKAFEYILGVADSYGKSVDKMVTNQENPDNAEFTTSVLLGGLLGLVGGVAGGVRETNQERLIKDQRINLSTASAFLADNLKSFIETEEVEEEVDGKKVKKQKFKFDDQGKPIYKIENGAQLVQDMLYEKMLMDTDSSVSGDNFIHKDLLQEMSLARWAFKYLGVEEGIDIAKAVVSDPKQFAEMHGVSIDVVEKNAKEITETFDKYQKLYDLIYGETKTKNESGTAAEDAINDKLLKTLFYEGVKQIAVDNLLNKYSEIGQIPNPLGFDLNDNELYENASVYLNHIKKDSVNKFKALFNQSNFSNLKQEMLKEYNEDLQQELKDLQTKIKDGTATAEDKSKAKEILVYQKFYENYRKELKGSIKDIEKKQVEGSDLDIAFSESARNSGYTRGMLAKKLITVARSFKDNNTLQNNITSLKEDIAMGLDYKDKLSKILDELIKSPIPLSKLSKKMLDQLILSNDSIVGEALTIEVVNKQNKIAKLDLNDPAQKQEAEKLNQELNTITKELFPKLTQLQEGLQSIIKKQNEEEKQIQEDPNEFVKSAFFNQMVLLPNNVLNSILANEEEYDDVESVTESIDLLKTLITFYKRTGTPKYTYEDEDSLRDTLEELKRLLEKVEKNSKNKLKEQQDLKETSEKVAFKGLGIEIDKKNKSITVKDQELYSAIEEIIGNEVFSKILNEAANDVDKQFDQVYLETIYELIKKSKADKTKLKALISKNIDVKDVFFDSDFEGYNTQLINAPQLTVFNVFFDLDRNFKITNIRYNNPSTFPQFSTHPILSYLDHGNYYKFIKDLNNLKETDRDTNYFNYVEFLKHQETIEKFLAVNEMNHYLNSTVSVTDVTTLEASIFNNNKTGLTNSPQQRNSFRKLIYSLFNDSKASLNVIKDFALVKGYGGTGKSSVVLKNIYEFAKKHLNITDENFIFAGHTEQSTKNLVDSLGVDSSRSAIFSDLLNNDISDKVKFIIIDEALAVDISDIINFLYKVQLHNNKKGTDVKVILSGDPAQITNSGILADSPFSMIREVNLAVDSFKVKSIEGKKPILSIFTGETLTDVFRGSNPFIMGFASLFRGKATKVTSGVAYASTKDALDKNTEGVVVGNSIKNVLESRRGNGKTKAIIVNNKSEKSNYTSFEDEYKVLTYEEAQSQTFDEVFVDLNQDLNDAFTKPFTNISFNKAMYVAVSRAKSFVYVVDPKGTFSQDTKSNLKEYRDSINKYFEQNKEQYAKDLELEQEILKRYFEFETEEVKPTEPIPPTQEPEETTPTPEDEDDDNPSGPEVLPEDEEEDEIDEEDFPEEEEVPENEPPIVIPPSITEGFNNLGDKIIHKIKQPISSALKFLKDFFDENEKIPVLYISEMDNTTKQPRISIVGVITGKEGKKYYKTLGVLDNSELAQFNSEFGIPKESLQISFANDNINYELVNNLDKYIVTEGYVEGNKNLKSLKHNIKNTYYTPNVKNIITNYIKEMYKNYPSKDSPEFKKYTNELLKNSSVHIYTHQEIEQLKREDSYGFSFMGGKAGKDNFRVLAGIPYLVIPPFHKGERLRHVSLQPRTLNKNKDSQLFSLLDKALISIERLQNLTNSKLGVKDKNNIIPISEIIKMFAKDFTVVNGKIEVGKQTVSLETEFGTQGLKLKDIVPAQHFEEVRKIAYELIPSYFGYKRKIKTFNTKEEAEAFAKQENLSVQIEEEEKNNKKGSIYKLKYTDATRVDNSKTSYVTREQLIAGKGVLQKELNNLARSNWGNAFNSIRVKRLKAKVFGKNKQAVRAKFLFSADTSIPHNFKLSATAYRKQLREVLKKYNIKVKGNINIDYNDDIAFRKALVSLNGLFAFLMQQDSISKEDKARIQAANDIFKGEEAKSELIENLKLDDLQSIFNQSNFNSQGDLIINGKRISKNINLEDRTGEVKRFNKHFETLDDKKVEELKEFVITNFDSVEGATGLVRIDKSKPKETNEEENKTSSEENTYRPSDLNDDDFLGLDIFNYVQQDVSDEEVEKRKKNCK